MSGDATAVFAAARDALDRAGVPFALVGAHGLSAHMMSRATLDLDLLVGDPGAPLDEVLDGLLLVEQTRDAFFDQAAYIFEVGTRVTPIEMFVASHWLTKEALALRTLVDLPPYGRVGILPAHAAAALKAVVASHPSRPPWKRDIDRGDLAGLRDASGLDRAWLSRTAGRLGEGARALLREAGLIDPA